MSLFGVISILITVTALFSYINHRLIKLPPTIGLMFMTIVFALGLIAAGWLGFSVEDMVRDFVQGLNFNEILLGGMLSFLLFAGALHVDINDLLSNKFVITILATLGVLGSTFIVGTAFYYLLVLLQVKIDYLYCLVFGALISPTDPISVLGIMTKAGAPKRLEAKIAGESLFNDGVGVVVFVVLLGAATGAHGAGLGEVLLVFIEEAVGGLSYGLLLGLVAYRLLKSVDNYEVEILITLAVATGGYALALKLHTSGPLAIVVAGLFIGNHGRRFAMSDRTREHLDTFWKLVDEILNALLFVLIGLEVVVLTLSGKFILAGLLTIPIALTARFITVGIPVWFLSFIREFSPNAVRIMTWGGLRGGISVALALSLPAGPEREVILTVTYLVVAFSILVQGLTVKRLVRPAA